VRQVQSIDHEIITAYELREKRSLDVSEATMEEVRTGMIEVVNGANGTGHEAELNGVEVAGKTGTAQWGPKNKERTAAWFAGFLPAEEPKYAFAAVYEGDVGSKVHGGTTGAPMIADIFQEIYKGSAANKRGTRESAQQIRRAQPVEEDDSD
jgi:penicillin-binding protein 2